MENSLLIGLLPGIASVLLVLFRVMLGACLVAGVPAREGLALRVARGTMGMVAVVSVTLFLAAGLWEASARSVLMLGLWLFSFFSLALVCCVAVVRYVFQMSWLPALFCCLGGYTIQNLASGAEELVRVLASGPGEPRSMSVCYFVLFAATTLACFVPYWFFFARPVNKVGCARVRDRSLLVVMAVVVMVVIGFDIVVKELALTGELSTTAVVVLRGMHGLACVFVLWLLYVLLIRSNLEKDVEVQRRILAERNRQYRGTRESVSAINALLHDIIHVVMRHMDDADESDRKLFEDVIREIKVYDTQMDTGNAALDAILAEKMLVCGRRGIALTCMADGAALDGMADGDLSALVDGLIGAVIDTGSTSVSFTVRRRCGAVSIRAEGNGDALSDPALVREVVERHGGSLFVTECRADALVPSSGESAAPERGL